MGSVVVEVMVVYMMRMNLRSQEGAVAVDQVDNVSAVSLE